MRTPYRVIVWGPGAVGGACLRSIISRPEFNLVGVLANSPNKIGRDAGELVDMPLTGINVTGDKEQIFAMDADCVIYTPRDPGDFSTDDEIVRLLESGKNVITALPYHFLQLRGEAVVEKFEAACRKGNACLHASGSDPGFMGERLALTLTGLCTDVKYIKLEEVYECSLVSSDLLAATGFGSDPNDLGKQQILANWAGNYLRQVVAHGGHAMGVAFDRIEQKTTVGIAPADIESSSGMVIKKGAVAAITNSWIGVVDGFPFYTLTVYWYLTKQMQPFDVPSKDHWIITLEGTPSARLTLDLKASVENDIYVGADNTPAGLAATGYPLVQAVPVVCSHAPGIVNSSVSPHWMKDLRGLEKRRS